MVINIILGGAIFGYAGWALVRFINRSKKGKCAACEIQDTCAGGCEPSGK
nr:FeoB-associated Cys-rich membrane protein [Bacillus sp. FJAT-27245]